MASIFDEMPDADSSHWVRLYRKLKARRDELTEGILSGDMDAQQYAADCGRYRELNQTILDMEAMTRGEDRQQQPAEEEE
jgi:hypothetical protein